MRGVFNEEILFKGFIAGAYTSDDVFESYFTAQPGKAECNKNGKAGYSQPVHEEKGK